LPYAVVARDAPVGHTQNLKMSIPRKFNFTTHISREKKYVGLVNNEAYLVCVLSHIELLGLFIASWETQKRLIAL
jgi:hypothetical protein